MKSELLKREILKQYKSVRNFAENGIIIYIKRHVYENSVVKLWLIYDTSFITWSCRNVPTRSFLLPLTPPNGQGGTSEPRKRSRP